MNDKIKILVVDDSIFMRKALENMLHEEADMEVVGLAHNGEEAVEMAASLKPDIITMDIEMPRMDGISALKIIMKDNPTPVIMVSSLTKEGADATIHALELGAVDFVPKNTQGLVGTNGIEGDLKAKIRRFARNKAIMRLLSFTNSTLKSEDSFRLSHSSFDKSSFNKQTVIDSSGQKRLMSFKCGLVRLVAIGTSTGGPQSLQRVIPKLPGDLGVPIVITQHMPPNFTKSLADRLNSLSNLTVVEAKEKEKLEPNVVYIAKGGLHMIFKKVGMGVYTDLTPEPSNYFNIPSVDVMVSSATQIYRDECLGVIMTGMGSDGTNGLKELKKAGGTVIAQDEASSIVYGMPKSVVEAGIADEVVPLDDIADRIVFHTK